MPTFGQLLLHRHDFELKPQKAIRLLCESRPAEYVVVPPNFLLQAYMMFSHPALRVWKQKAMMWRQKWDVIFCGHWWGAYISIECYFLSCNGHIFSSVGLQTVLNAFKSSLFWFSRVESHQVGIQVMWVHISAVCDWRRTFSQRPSEVKYPRDGMNALTFTLPSSIGFLSSFHMSWNFEIHLPTFFI